MPADLVARLDRSETTGAYMDLPPSGKQTLFAHPDEESLHVCRIFVVLRTCAFAYEIPCVPMIPSSHISRPSDIAILDRFQ